MPECENEYGYICLLKKLASENSELRQKLRELEYQLQEREEENARWRERSKKLLTIANELLDALEKEDD